MNILILDAGPCGLGELINWAIPTGSFTNIIPMLAAYLGLLLVLKVLLGISTGMSSSPATTVLITLLLKNWVTQTILPYLEAQGMYSRSWFGAWKYEMGNMDHSFMQGVEVVCRILRQGSEPTANGTVL